MIRQNNVENTDLNTYLNSQYTDGSRFTAGGGTRLLSTLSDFYDLSEVTV